MSQRRMSINSEERAEKFNHFSSLTKIRKLEKVGLSFLLKGLNPATIARETGLSQTWLELMQRRMRK